MVYPFSAQEAEIIRPQEVLSPQHPEIFDRHQYGRIGAAFRMDSTDGDPHGSTHRMGLKGAIAAKRSQSFLSFGVQAASAIAGSRGKTRRLK